MSNNSNSNSKVLNQRLIMIFPVLRVMKLAEIYTKNSRWECSNNNNEIYNNTAGLLEQTKEGKWSGIDVLSCKRSTTIKSLKIELWEISHKNHQFKWWYCLSAQIMIVSTSNSNNVFM